MKRFHRAEQKSKEKEDRGKEGSNEASGTLGSRRRNIGQWRVILEYRHTEGFIYRFYLSFIQTGESGHLSDVFRLPVLPIQK